VSSAGSLRLGCSPRPTTRKPGGRAQVLTVDICSARRRRTAEARCVGTREGVPHLRRDRQGDRGSRAHEGASRRLHDVPDRPRRRASSKARSTSVSPHEQPLVEEEVKAAPKARPSTVEPSLDSLRLYLREIGKVPLLTADQEVYLAKRIRARRHGREDADDRGQPAPRRVRSRRATSAAGSRSST